MSERKVWVALAGAALLAAGVFALHSPWLSLHEIEILGAVRSDPAARLEEAGVGEGAILIWIDTGAVERAVLSDPWVAAVQAERIWPDRLTVEVVEHEPVAWVEGFTTWMLVAADGTVLETAPGAGGGYLKVQLALPDRLPGERPSDPVWAEVVALAATLSGDIGGSMTIAQRGAELWTTVFGHPVRFGNATDLADKGRTLRALLQENLPVGATIDVSSPLRPVVIPGENLQVPVEGSEE